MKKLPQEPQEELAQIGTELAALDLTLVACVARRIELSLKVIQAKTRASQGAVPQIVRPDIEKKRIVEVSELAAQLGVERSLAEAIESILINASIKAQVATLANPPGPIPSSEQLVKNLLALTADVAEGYGKVSKTHGSCPTTDAVRRFETEAISEAIEALEIPRELIVDVGCANGQELLRHAQRFSRGLGLDISPEMIGAGIAAAGPQDNHASSRVTFVNVNVEEVGIPAKDGEASFVILNNGTGSDFLDLPKVLAEITRVLKVGGRFFASFHNAAAVTARGAPLPWVSAMRATPDRDRQTMRVRTADGKVHEIPGQAYSRGDVERATPDSLQALSVVTFPHTLSLLPSGVLAHNPKLRQELVKIDRAMATAGHDGGSYLMVSGVKV